MKLERSIERAGQKMLRDAGYVAEKWGRAGWPDRMVFVAPGMHEWIEWKRPGGKLTAAQRVRIPKLRAAGEVVHVLDSTVDVLDLIRRWTAIYGRPSPAIRAL